MYDRPAAWHIFLTASRSNRLCPGCREACWLLDAPLVCPVCRGSRVPTLAATSKNDDDNGSTAAAADDFDYDYDGDDEADSGSAVEDGFLEVKMLATSAP